MTYIQNLWIKEYADVPWMGLLILFVIASLPFLIKGMSKSSIFILLGYDCVVNYVIPAILRPSTAASLGTDNFTTAFLLSFGVGYSLLCLRREKKSRAEDAGDVFSTISLIFFSAAAFLVALSNIKYF
jgi:hypothetical protein